MGNPLVPQGTINRLRGSIVLNSFPQLNVTAPFLGRDGIRIAFEGNVVEFFPTMSGGVTSLEPYQFITVTAALLKSQSLSDAYKQQQELNALIGDFVVRPDAATLSPYQITNGGIEGVGDLTFNGLDPIYGVRLKGYYNLNSAAWDF